MGPKKAFFGRCALSAIWLLVVFYLVGNSNLGWRIGFIITLSKGALHVARGIVSGMSDPAVLLDRDLVMVTYSPSYPALAGLRNRQFVKAIRDGGNTFDFVGGDPTEARNMARMCMKNRKAMHFAEEVVRNQNGDELTVILSYLPVLKDDEAIGVIQSFRDVSAEARMQGRYRKLLVQERLRAENLEREVDKRTQELSSALEEVTRLSRVDPLTGILNRRAFTELAEQAIKLAKRHGRSMGLLLGDIDFFKKVNDEYGHLIGDKILVSTAGAISHAVRDSDPVARFGGEEFVILLTETERDSVPVVGERVRRLVSEIRNLEGAESEWPKTTLSLGMAVFPDHGESLDELVSNADKALYRAKETGRNRIVMYDESEFAETDPGNAGFPREILVVGSGRADAFAESLGDSFAVSKAVDVDEALRLGAEQDFEVLIVDCAEAEDGVEFLRKTQRYCPQCLRILVIDSKDVFVEMRGAGLARIDSFLLREEATEHIRSAIDDGLARRDIDRQKLMMRTDSVRRLYSTRLQELETLIEERQLEFAYQPIVNPATREIFAYEALCRAKHPIFRNPQVLFDAAVQSGILWELGRAVREISVQALSQLPSNIKLFMNLHPGEVEDPELATFRGSATAKRIVFEITERASIPDYGRFRAIISELAKGGYEFAIDDLGAGYAGLNAVALLSPDFIKIDMAMVRNIHLAPQRAKLIRRIVDFANDVGIRLVAEGIESKEEADVIQALGCHLAQGYFYGRPRIGIPGSDD